jgi:hypothetical protein
MNAPPEKQGPRVRRPKNCDSTPRILRAMQLRVNQLRDRQARHRELVMFYERIIADLELEIYREST